MRAVCVVVGVLGLLAGCASTPQDQLRDGLLSSQGLQPAIRTILKEADVSPSDVKPSKISGYWEVSAGARRYLVNEAGSTLTVFGVSGEPAVLTLEKVVFISPTAAPIAVLPVQKTAAPAPVLNIQAPVRPALPVPAVAAPNTVGGAARVGFNAQGMPLSADDKAAQVRAIYAGLPEGFTINFPVKTPIRTIIVFSDYGCTYCQRLHADIPALNAAGISVRYLLFPRSGVDVREQSVQSTLNVMRNMWCAEDQRAASDQAYRHESPPEVACDQPYNKTRSDFPVLAHHMLGQVFSVQGTPFIFSDDGRTQEGYADVDQLKTWLGLK